MIGTELNVRVRRRGRRPAGPVSLSIFAFILTAMAALLFFFSFHVRAESAQSEYIQAHGMSRQATVISVDNIQHQSHSQNGTGTVWYTADITASLNPAVGGLSETTVHVPHQVSYSDGQTVPVLVDPRAPGYAELPGQPDVTAKDWWATLAGGAVCVLLACFLGWQAIAKVRRRRIA
jgi:hypothetical protein